jgi:putative dehydrogenase
MKPVVAVIAQGSMGSGVARRLTEHGIEVLTSLAGRSKASAERAREAGMQAVSDVEVARADFFLSIVPPGEALTLAEKFAPVFLRHNRKPVFVDCNAVNPDTKSRIAGAIATAGCPFVDAGIIGGPPKSGYSPAFYASGPDAPRVAVLCDYGLDIRVLDGPVGKAAALKMSYAGITKGLTAIGAAMMLASARAGTAEALHRELAQSQPALLAWLGRQVPSMYGKAYRWVADMEEIAAFAGEDAAAGEIYAAAARFYERLAADFEDEKKEIGALQSFLTPPQ